MNCDVNEWLDEFNSTFVYHDHGVWHADIGMWSHLASRKPDSMVNRFRNSTTPTTTDGEKNEIENISFMVSVLLYLLVFENAGDFVLITIVKSR